MLSVLLDAFKELSIIDTLKIGQGEIIAWNLFVMFHHLKVQAQIFIYLFILPYFSSLRSSFFPSQLSASQYNTVPHKASFSS